MSAADAVAMVPFATGSARSTRVIASALTVLALTLPGCGASSEGSSSPGRGGTAPGVGADTPEGAVTEFLSVAGHPGNDYAKLEEACRRVAPSVRPALRFEASVTPSDTNCASALALMLFYTGDTGDFQVPTGMSGEVTDVNEQGDRAVVEASMRYEGASNPGADTTRVLTVREQGEWWIATPSAFNVRSASKPPTDGELDAQYRQLVAAAEKAGREHQAGRDATTKVGSEPRACSTDAASSARDTTGDVKVADGMAPAEQAPGSHDITSVTHSNEGSHACFELRLAADAPEAGAVEIGVRPDGGRVQVRWADGEAVGQRGSSSDQPTAVRVDATRAGSTMTFRLPADSLGIGAGPYRWAVELFTPTGEERVTHFDSVPDDLTLMGDRDHYIRHGG